MESSDNRDILPPYSHHHHHQCLELSPHCPQHAPYLFPPNTHHHRHSAAASGHHHHLQLSPDCPLHRHLLPPCPLHTFHFHPNYQSFSSIPLPPNPNFISIPPEAAADVNPISEALMMQDGNEGDEDEVIFVLTDEWKEFFAKSEAKRRLKKKQAKNKGKH